MNLSDIATGANSNPFGIAGVTVNNVGTINVTSGEAIGATGAGNQVNTASSIEGLAGLTQLTIKDVGGTYLKAATTANVTVTDLAQAATNEQVEGGQNVSITTNATSTGTITVGALQGTPGTATSTPVGTVTINENVASAATSGTITVNGGTVDTITVTPSTTVGATSGSGAINVNGSAVTTSVTVNQSALATASATVAGVTDGVVTIKDANFGSATKAATITSVTLANYGTGSAISSNALNSLTLSGTGGTGAMALGLTEGLTSPTNTTLALNLNGLGNSTTAAVITDSSNQFQTLNVATGANASYVTFADTALKTVAITGTGAITSDLTNGGLNTQLATVTDSDIGVSTLTIGTGASFTGAGSGQDIITLSGATTGTITGAPSLTTTSSLLASRALASARWAR